MIDLLLIRIAAKVFPLRTPPEYAGLDFSALKSKYRKTDLASLFAFLVLAPVAVYLCHKLLIAYAGMHAPQSGTVYRLTADTNFWYAPASFLGIVAACFVIHLCNRASLPDSGREYRYWFNANAGFSASKMFLLIGIVFAASGLLLAYFAARTYFELTPTELVVRRIWSLQEERHPYSQIAALIEAVDAREQSSDFVIEFIGTEPWSTAVEVIFPAAEHKAFLEKMTGKKIQIVPK